MSSIEKAPIGNQDDEVFFRISPGDHPQVSEFAARLVEEFDKHPLLKNLDYKGGDEGCDAIAQRVGDSQGILRQVRKQLVDAFFEAYIEFVADKSEIEGPFTATLAKPSAAVNCDDCTRASYQLEKPVEFSK